MTRKPITERKTPLRLNDVGRVQPWVRIVDEAGFKNPDESH